MYISVKHSLVYELCSSNKVALSIISRFSGCRIWTTSIFICVSVKMKYYLLNICGSSIWIIIIKHTKKHPCTPLLHFPSAGWVCASLRSGSEQRRSPPPVALGGFKSRHINNGASRGRVSSSFLPGFLSIVLPDLANSMCPAPPPSPSPLPADLFSLPPQSSEVGQKLRKGRKKSGMAKKKW